MTDNKNAVNDFIEMIEQSWTWEKLTHNERSIFYEFIGDLEHANTVSRIKGSYKQRYDTMHMLYSIYLAALGYTGGPNWR